MAEKQGPDDGPSLEMPSLGSLFKRGKKPVPASEDLPTADDFERLVRGETTPVDTTAPAAPADVAPAAPAAPQDVVPQKAAEPAPVEPATPERAAEATAAPADISPTTILDELPEHHLIDDDAEPDLDDLVDDEAEEAPKPARSLSDLSFSLPAIDGRIAAAITGAVVGLLAVALTYSGLQGCEAVKGTSSCGGPGIGILVLIMVVLVMAGSVLLAAWKITDPTSTSFLAVGLLAVIALLFLIDVIFERSMLVVIPLVSVGTYLLSHFVTSRFIEEE